MRISRRILLAAALGAGGPMLRAAGGRAQTPDGPPADGPAAPVARLNAALRKAMVAGRRTPFATRMAELRPVIVEVFDLPVILRTAVGLRWPSIPAGQQDQLREAFTRFTVASYVANFDDDTGATFRILADQREAGADRIVQTQIVPKPGAGGDPTRIDYVMRRSDRWRAVDVLSEGISQVAVQRSDFRGRISEGDATRLIRALDDKVATFAAHAGAA